MTQIRAIRVDQATCSSDRLVKGHPVLPLFPLKGPDASRRASHPRRYATARQHGVSVWRRRQRCRRWTGRRETTEDRIDVDISVEVGNRLRNSLFSEQLARLAKTLGANAYIAGGDKGGGGRVTVAYPSFRGNLTIRLTVR